jgi:hypothetical protein
VKAVGKQNDGLQGVVSQKTEVFKYIMGFEIYKVLSFHVLAF